MGSVSLCRRVEIRSRRPCLASTTSCHLPQIGTKTNIHAGSDPLLCNPTMHRILRVGRALSSSTFPSFYANAAPLRASLRYATRRLNSTKPPTGTTTSQPQTKQRARLHRILSSRWIPKVLRSQTEGLKHAPLTHIVAFLVLHEITAIVPLVGLATWFHWAGWLPPVSVSFELCTPSRHILKHKVLHVDSVER